MTEGVSLLLRRIVSTRLGSKPSRPGGSVRGCASQPLPLRHGANRDPAINPQSGRLSLRTTPVMAASTPPLDPFSSAGVIEHP